MNYLYITLALVLIIILTMKFKPKILVEILLGVSSFIDRLAYKVDSALYISSSVKYKKIVYEKSKETSRITINGNGHDLKIHHCDFVAKTIQIKDVKNLTLHYCSVGNFSYWNAENIEIKESRISEGSTGL